jgi:hypothetical protein
MGASTPSGKPSPLEESRSEFSPAVSEPVMILRVAQGMVLPLRFASDVGERVLQVRVQTRGVPTETISVPFRVRRTVVDPATKLKVRVGLSSQSRLATCPCPHPRAGEPNSPSRVQLKDRQGQVVAGCADPAECKWHATRLVHRRLRPRG